MKSPHRDEGDFIHVISSFGEEGKETLLFVPLDLAQEGEMLWEGDAISSIQ